MNADLTRKSVDDTSRELLIGEPYYGHLLVGMVRIIGNGASAARLVSAHTPQLEIGGDLWSALSSAGRKATLKHELLHLTFKHPMRARDFARLDLYGLACDLVVNQFMDTRELDGALTIADFPELELERDRTADHYYERLLPLYEKCCRASACSGEGDAEDSDSKAQGSMREWLEGTSCACQSHRGWQDFAKMPAPALSVLEANVDALVEATVKRARSRNWGRLPGSLHEYLEGLVDKRHEVPWRRVLRLFGATSERTYLKNTIARPSKRYGTCPGIRVKRKTDVVVAVDTSGSVPTEDIALFFSEVDGIWRRGASITILECDAGIAREYAYRGTPPKSAAGRGGTSFDPALERANVLRPDALIYFTDGYAPAPTPKARMPVLWVLSTEGRALSEATDLPGRRVKLTRKIG